MTELELKPELKLVFVRCYYCNRFYGYEKQHAARCPHCAETQVAELEATIESARAGLDSKACGELIATVTQGVGTANQLRASAAFAALDKLAALLGVETHP